MHTRTPAPSALGLVGMAALLLLAPSTRTVAAQAVPGSLTSLREQSLLRSNKLWADAETPVVFSFSGGISLGAYQAGVNWAMLEMIKASHYAPDPASRPTRSRLSVGAMTGASAGNINVMLAAVEYCDRNLARAAEKSLFWQMWVGSGWDDLFPRPEHRGPDAGVLDRSAVRRRLLDTLKKDLDRRDFDPTCSVPIGVVTTKVRPGSIAYDRHITVQSQRYAALYEARVLGKRLRFVRARDSLLEKQAIGSQLVLPFDANRVISPDRVFSLTEASSSYPIAFAPVDIEYFDPVCVLERPDPPGCATPHKEPFMDGGVFDNNPVSLAVDIYRTVAPGAKQRVLYVDPDAARDPLDADLSYRRTQTERDVPPGVGALLRFGLGFVPASRNYELQSFIRSQADELPQQQAVILSSTRAHPVIGEHLGAFAAFLGQPFRELDFYIGVADGMQFLATEILCHDEAYASGLRSSDLATVRGAQQRHMDCVEETTTRLAREAFILSPVGRYIVMKVLRREYPSLMVPLPSMADEGERARYVILDGLEEATFSKLEDREPYGCPEKGLVMRAICADGFDRVLAAADSNPDLMAVLECTSTGECDKGRVPRYPGRLEQTLKLIEDPANTLDRIITEAFQQMRRTEKSVPGGGFAMPVKLVDLGWRSIDGSNQTWDMGPSSIPRNDGLAWRFMRALPYYSGLSLDGEGAQVGWQPSRHYVWKSVGLFAPFELSWQPRGYDAQQQNAASFSVTPSVGMDFLSPIVNQVLVGARVSSTGRGEDLSARRPMFEFSSYLLLRKVRFSGYLVPARYTAKAKDRWVVTASIADLNGALYWLVR